MKKYIHKLTRSKRSYYLIIPAEIVKKYAWKERQKITIEDKGRGELKIRDWRKR